MASRRTQLVSLIMLTFTSSAAIGNDAISNVRVAHDKRVTHLNVQVGEIVNLSTFCAFQDGQIYPLFYDRAEPQLTIPKGWSLVITDVIVTMCNFDAGQEARWDFVLQGTDARSFTISFRGDTTKHYQFSGGLAFSADNLPAVRSLRTTNTSGANVQVLGYFVKGNALPPGAPRF
jgi:hypothetical protein